MILTFTAAKDPEHLIFVSTESFFSPWICFTRLLPALGIGTMGRAVGVRRKIPGLPWNPLAQQRCHFPAVGLRLYPRFDRFDSLLGGPCRTGPRRAWVRCRWEAMAMPKATAIDGRCGGGSPWR
jgi:hypothetical protein